MEILVSLLLALTLGCGVVSCIMLMLFYKFIAGALFPFIAGGLMYGSYRAMEAIKPRPHDPKHMRIQQSVVIGGLLAVVLAYAISGSITPKELLYAGGGMSFLAILSIALDQSRIASSRRQAENAMKNALEAQKRVREAEYKTAEEMLQEALLTTEVAYGSFHPQVATIVLYLADLMRLTERLEAAGVLYERAVGVYATLGYEGPEFVNALIAYAEHLRRKGEYDSCYAMAARGVTESKKLPERNDLTGRCYIMVSLAQAAQDKLQEAYDSCQLATDLLTRSVGKNHAATLRARGVTANHCVKLGRVAEAERILREVILEKQNLGQDEDSAYLGLLIDLSLVQKAKKVFEEQAYNQNMLKAVRLYRASVGPEYERSEELTAILPEYLSKGQIPELREFYDSLFKREYSAARRVLDRCEAIAKTADNSDWTPLQWCSFFDVSDLASSLLSRDADVEYGKGKDLPPYYIAARWGCRAVLTMLGRRDCDFEIPTGDGSQPIHAAVRSGDQLTFDTVVTKRVTLDRPNKRGWTPLHDAAYCGERKFVTTLISKGLDVNFQAPERNESPLHAAVMGGDKGTVEILILNMADPNTPDAQYVTPLGLAERLGHKEIASTLKAYAESQRKEATEEAEAAARAKAKEQQAQAEAEAEQEASGKEEG